MDQATPANIFITSTCLALSSKIINRLFLPALQSLRNTPRSKSRVHQVGSRVHGQNVFEDISAIEFFSDQDPAEAFHHCPYRQSVSLIGYQPLRSSLVVKKDVYGLPPPPDLRSVEICSDLTLFSY
jgi:hypothetical protein